MAGADDLGAGVAEQLLHRLGQIADGGGIALLHEQIARVGMLEGKLHQVHRLVQVHQKTGHVRVGDGDGLAGLDLVDEQGNHAAAAAHHVAVTGAADGGILCLYGAGLGADHLFHHGLGDAHGVDGVGGFVGGQADHLFHARVNGGGEHVVGADHVGAHGLHGEELTAGHLLQGCGMEDVVHAPHRAAHAVDLAHVADVKAQLACQLGVLLLDLMAHVILLFLIAGEDADLADVASQEMLEHRVAEAAGAAGDQKGFVGEITVCHKKASVLFLLQATRGKMLIYVIRIP